MKFTVLDFIAALDDLIEENEINQFDEMTAENLEKVKIRAEQYAKKN